MVRRKASLTRVANVGSWCDPAACERQKNDPGWTFDVPRKRRFHISLEPSETPQSVSGAAPPPAIDLDTALLVATKCGNGPPVHPVGRFFVAVNRRLRKS